MSERTIQSMYWVRHNTKKTERSMTVASYQHLKRTYTVIGHFNPETNEVTPLSENPTTPQHSRASERGAGAAAGDKIGKVNPNNDNDGELLTGDANDQDDQVEESQEEEGEVEAEESTVEAPSPEHVETAIEETIAEDQFKPEASQEVKGKAGVPKGTKNKSKKK